MRELENKKSISIAILVYIYHIEPCEEILLLLSKLDLSNTNTDIFLAINKDTDPDKIRHLLYKYNINVKNIIFTDNIGADILPFLEQINTINYDSYDIILKLHTKISMWGPKNNINWRSLLLHSLIGSDEIFKKNIKLLLDKPKIGMMTTKGLILKNTEGNNSNKIHKLLNLLGINYSIYKHGKFSAGSMFFIKPSILHILDSSKINSIKTLIIENKEFKRVKDINFMDGTYSHAMERIFGYLVKYNGMTINGIKLANYRILNKQSKKGYFNLVLCYNNMCYLEEDLTCTGKFFNINNSYCLIEWKHMKDKDSVFQKYAKLNHNTLIKDTN